MGRYRQPLLIVFAVEVGVDELLALRGRVDTPRPERCPGCGHGRLTFAGWWPKRTRRGRVDIHRVLCMNKACGKSHSCWPDLLVGRRIDLAQVIGEALEAKAAGSGHRKIAGGLGIPKDTVRGWLRRFALIAPRLTARLIEVAAAADPAVRAPPEGDPFTVAVAWVGIAAAALASLSGEPVDRWPFAVMVCAGGLLALPAEAAPDVAG